MVVPAAPAAAAAAAAAVQAPAPAAAAAAAVQADAEDERTPIEKLHAGADKLVLDLSALLFASVDDEPLKAVCAFWPTTADRSDMAKEIDQASYVCIFWNAENAVFCPWPWALPVC